MTKQAEALTPEEFDSALVALTDWAAAGAIAMVESDMDGLHGARHAEACAALKLQESYRARCAECDHLRGVASKRARSLVKLSEWALALNAERDRLRKALRVIEHVANVSALDAEAVDEIYRVAAAALKPTGEAPDAATGS